MLSRSQEKIKYAFKESLNEFVSGLKRHISTPDDQWTIKGFKDKRHFERERGVQESGGRVVRRLLDELRQDTNDHA